MSDTFETIAYLAVGYVLGTGAVQLYLYLADRMRYR
jgi:hypothetical protein